MATSEIYAAAFTAAAGRVHARLDAYEKILPQLKELQESEGYMEFYSNWLGHAMGDIPEAVQARAELMTVLMQMLDKPARGNTAQEIVATTVFLWEAFRPVMLPPFIKERADIVGGTTFSKAYEEIVAVNKSTEAKIDLIATQVGALTDAVKNMPKTPQRQAPVGSVEAKISPAVEQKLAANTLAIETMASRLAAQEAARKEALAKRELETAERKAAHAELMAKQKEAKEKRIAEAQAKRAEAQKARKEKLARKREIVSAKKKGENPYSEDETKAFIEKLAAKGKTYYTPEQRAEFKAQQKTVKAKPKTARKAFVQYTPEQKAAYKASLEAKGKTFFTKEQRAAHKSKLAKAKASAK